MKKCAFVLLSCVCVIGAANADHAADVVQQARTAMGNVIAALPPRRHGVCEYMKEFGYHYKQTQGYFELASLVSNNYGIAFANFSAIATNDLERMVFLSTSWAYDEDYYLVCFSNVLDFAISGVMSKDEFHWFCVSDQSVRLSGALPMRYDHPGISNLVLRMQTYTGWTNYCQGILNGSAKADYILHWDLSLGPPPCVNAQSDAESR